MFCFLLISCDFFPVLNFSPFSEDLFLDKHIASGDLRGLRTCMDYVDKAPVGLNSTIKSVNRDTSISRREWEEAQKIYHDLHRHGRRKK